MILSKLLTIVKLSIWSGGLLFSCCISIDRFLGTSLKRLETSWTSLADIFTMMKNLVFSRVNNWSWWDIFFVYLNSVSYRVWILLSAVPQEVSLEVMGWCSLYWLPVTSGQSHIWGSQALCGGHVDVDGLLEWQLFGLSGCVNYCGLFPFNGVGISLSVLCYC